MKTYFIETSVIIDFLRGKKQAVDIVESLSGEFTSSYLCLAELYEGIERSREKKAHEERILQFFNSLSFIYGLDGEIAKTFGMLRAKGKNSGTVLEDIDLFIAATCLVNDLELITFNQKHFSRIDQLQIYS